MTPYGVAVSSLKRMSVLRASMYRRSTGQDVNVDIASDPATTLRPHPPSRRFASVRMGEAAFLWLVAGWVAAVGLLLAGVLVARHLV
jgi:hypothetical protein